jgi:hypothetical protein
MSGDDGRETGERRRRERLSASLKANLKRRKAQSRGRDAAAQDPAQTGERPPAEAPETK